MAGNTVGFDDLVRPQNNATLIYDLKSGQWFWSPSILATCWEVLNGVSDIQELLRGAYQNVIIREDITEGDNRKSGDYNQIPASSNGTTETLKDVSKAWTTNEWAGAIVYWMRPDDTQIYSCTIASNTATILTGTAGTFQVDGVGAADVWDAGLTPQYPQNFDYYTIILAADNQDMTLRYESPKLTIGSPKKLKQFSEILIKVFATGNLTINWTIDDTISGTILFDLDQGATFWGINYFGVDDGATEPVLTGDVTLLWQALDEVMAEGGFDDTAEGHFIQLGFVVQTNSEFSLSMIAMDILRETRGGSWG